VLVLLAGKTEVDGFHGVFDGHGSLKLLGLLRLGCVQRASPVREVVLLLLLGELACRELVHLAVVQAVR